MMFGNMSGVARATLISIIALMLGACWPASESDLRQRFYDHKSTILQIREMQLQDSKVVRIAPEFTHLESDWSWPRKDIGFSDDRWNTYRTLFQTAGITDGIQNDDGYIFYFVSSEGLAVSGRSRGFVFTTTRPKNIAKSFDACPAIKLPCYIPLEDHWYLFSWST